MRYNLIDQPTNDMQGGKEREKNRFIVSYLLTAAVRSSQWPCKDADDVLLD